MALLDSIQNAVWQSTVQETDGDRETREIAKFAEFEATMPRLPSRLREASLFVNVSSYMGKRNPFAQPVDPQKHSLWLQDNTAYRPDNAGSKEWEAAFVAAYFIKNTGDGYSRIVADIAEKLGLGEGDEAEATIAKRLEPWIDAVLPAHTVSINIGGSHVAKLGPSDRSGVSSDIIRTRGSHADGETIESLAMGITANPMMTTFAEPTGWAVLSDIDDTIKITRTTSPLGILQSTFVDDPTPVAGMPELYAYIRKSLDNPPFWYLSASPYNLYPFLRNFRCDYYPPGPLLLRNTSWMDLAGFLTALTAGTQSYKTGRMKDIHRQFPKRKFLCVGDSTQSDPEAYGDMCRAFPGWVGAVFIRKVTGMEEMDASSKNKPERFEKAFAGVDRAIWTVFESPEELYERVDALVSVGDWSTR